MCRFLCSFLIAAICMAAFSSCASRKTSDLEAGFKPIQLYWSAAEGVDPDAEYPGKDECVIGVTGSLMSSPEVAASSLLELEYNATFAPNTENPGTYVFTGVCAGLVDSGLTECRWRATCDGFGKIVVNFHNEL